MRIASSEVFEAEDLLEEVSSWNEEDIEELPRLYREKAREYRSNYTQRGD
jgi:hypothetical protein